MPNWDAVQYGKFTEQRMRTTGSSFEASLAEQYLVAYRPEEDGATLFPFSRLLIVAIK